MAMGCLDKHEVSPYTATLSKSFSCKGMKHGALALVYLLRAPFGNQSFFAPPNYSVGGAKEKVKKKHTVKFHARTCNSRHWIWIFPGLWLW